MLLGQKERWLWKLRHRIVRSEKHRKWQKIELSLTWKCNFFRLLWMKSEVNHQKKEIKHQDNEQCNFYNHHDLILQKILKDFSWLFHAFLQQMKKIYGQLAQYFLYPLSKSITCYEQKFSTSPDWINNRKLIFLNKNVGIFCTDWIHLM